VQRLDLLLRIYLSLKKKRIANTFSPTNSGKYKTSGYFNQGEQEINIILQNSTNSTSN
jgi:hypothetical protein